MMESYSLSVGDNNGVLCDSTCDGWRPMETAPRDGTYVELKCTYGIAPWYCIARWTDEDVAYGQDGQMHPFKDTRLSWRKPDGGGPTDEQFLQWRPYTQDVASYTDPTGGTQNDPAYWRGAVASKYGLPLAYLEKIAAQNADRLTPNVEHKPSWWMDILRSVFRFKVGGPRRVK